MENKFTIKAKDADIIVGKIIRNFGRHFSIYRLIGLGNMVDLEDGVSYSVNLDDDYSKMRFNINGTDPAGSTGRFYFEWETNSYHRIIITGEWFLKYPLDIHREDEEIKEFKIFFGTDKSERFYKTIDEIVKEVVECYNEIDELKEKISELHRSTHYDAYAKRVELEERVKYLYSI